MSEVADTRVCMVTGPTSGLGKAFLLKDGLKSVAIVEVDF